MNLTVRPVTRLAGVLAALLLSGTAVCSELEPKTEKGPAKLQFTLSTAKGSTKLQESLVVTYRLTNPTSDTIKAYAPNHTWAPFLEFYISPPTGKSKVYSGRREGFMASVEVLFAPGTIKTADMVIDGTWFPVAGQYSIKARILVDNETYVTSNTVVVRVDPPVVPGVRVP